MSGRHVVVTGAGTGIGRAIALRLARDGARLSLMGRREGLLEETAGLARAEGSSVFTTSADVRERVAVDGAFERAAESLGPIDALVANAGIGGGNEAGDGDRFEDLVLTNLNGAYFCARAAQRHLASGPGARHIVLMSSILARIGVPGYTGYCASKAGMLGLARSLASELAAADVQVNAVCPGWVDTEMAREGLAQMARDMGVSVEQAHEAAMSQVPMGRMSRPEDVAGLVAWLLSEDARGVTGQSVDMNGGAFMI